MKKIRISASIFTSEPTLSFDIYSQGPFWTNFFSSEFLFLSLFQLCCWLGHTISGSIAIPTLDWISDQQFIWKGFYHVFSDIHIHTHTHPGTQSRERIRSHTNFNNMQYLGDQISRRSALAEMKRIFLKLQGNKETASTYFQNDFWTFLQFKNIKNLLRL